MRRVVRVYPSACRSSSCSDPNACGTCANRHVREDFDAWVERTGATVADPVWSPNVYEATIVVE